MENKHKSNGISMGPSHWKIVDRWAEKAETTRSAIVQNMVEHLCRHDFVPADPDGFWWTWREKE